MSLTEYGFALFIFILVCLFALLCKYLFGRTKTRLQALDEKEKKLLAFYSTLEEMMDEFNDSAVQANTELAQQITAMRNVAASLRTQAAAQPALQAQPQAQQLAQTQPQAQTQVQQQPAVSAIRQTMPAAAMRPRSAPVRAANANTNYETPVFEVITDAAPPIPPVQAQETTQPVAKATQDRPTRILTLHKNGMDRLLIAKELSVTLSEVDLVLGIAGQR